MAKTTIQWSEHSWNPVGGCFKKSPGCYRCYAIRVARRLGGNPNEKIRAHYDGLTVIQGGQPNWSGEVTLNERVLMEPLKRKQPTTYFISLSDLFYDKRPDEHIDRVFAVMALTPHHTYQLLTKYAERMVDYFRKFSGGNHCVEVENIGRGNVRSASWIDPLPNVHLGVSVENQQYADERIPLLLRTPAAVRFVSYEPALGPVDLDLPRCDAHDRDDLATDDDGFDFCVQCAEDGRSGELSYGHWLDPLNGGIAWVIVGGESGPGARPFDIEWARNTIAQCKAANVPVFVKQLGAKPYCFAGDPALDFMGGEWVDSSCRQVWLHGKDKKGGTMDEWPEDLRVRDLPTDNSAPGSGSERT